jgi:DNA end-binding protein Ku
VAQAVWTGQLSFGLVNIPIKLYSATAPKSVRFHQYDAQTGRRIKYRRVAEGTETEPPSSLQGGETSSEPTLAASTERPEARRAEREVQWREVVKGFEIEPGRIVTVTAEELEPLVPEQTRSLEVEQFVPLSDIDPVYFDKSYYVAPGRGVGTERPYWLLYRALEAGGEVLSGRGAGSQHLVAASARRTPGTGAGHCPAVHRSLGRSLGPRTPPRPVSGAGTRPVKSQGRRGARCR